MKAMIKSVAAAAMFALATPAFAGGITVAKEGDSKLKLEALFYLNTYSQKAETTTGGTTTSIDTIGMAVDRAYFTAKYYFNDDWMMRFTTDIGHEGTLGKQQNIYLKYAYVEGKLVGKAAVLRVGQSHTPWIDYEQGLWKYRYVSKVMSDQYKFDDSSDLGFGLKGELADGMFGYWATVTNGSGYGKGTRTNGIDYNVRLGVYPLEGLTIDGQYRSGYRGTKTTASAGVKSTFYQVMASYGNDDFRVGANYQHNLDEARAAVASTTHGGNVSSAYATAAVGDQVKSTGYDLWARGKFASDFGAFGRYEHLNNKNTVGGAVNPVTEKIDRFMAGVEYSALKGVDFSLVYDYSKLANRGGTPGNERKDTRFGLYSQVKL